VRFVTIGTAAGGLCFYLFGEPTRFPGSWFGFAAFLVFAFVVGLYMYDKVD